MNLKIALCYFVVAAGSSACSQKVNQTQQEMKFEVRKSEEEWRQQLTPEQFRVLREKGTERPYSGELYYVDEAGTYHCAACNNPLFRSDSKYDAHCGWPSFYEPISPNSVLERPDNSHGMIRTEVICGKCGGHLGHVFNDGPNPTGLRYCINSASLGFEKKGPQ
jgi:peptide-methionine (R)-S-oxide reductase